MPRPAAAPSPSVGQGPADTRLRARPHQAVRAGARRHDAGARRAWTGRGAARGQARRDHAVGRTGGSRKEGVMVRVHEIVPGLYQSPTLLTPDDAEFTDPDGN